MKKANQFKYKINFLKSIIGYLRYKIFLFLFYGKALDIFVKSGDSISISPISNGKFEPHLVEVIRFFSSEYNNFFLDIGANIGLISVQVGNYFDYVEMIEPNQIVCNVLKSNIMLNLNGKYKINEFGLGDHNEYSELIVPKRNFGGGFVNKYSRYDEVNIGIDSICIPIELKSSDEFFSNFFSIISIGHKGVIKIDVEGMELVIIRSLLKALPKSISIVIIFENWDKVFMFPTLFQDYTVYKIIGENMDKMPILRRALFRIRYGWNFSLSSTFSNPVGNLVVEVNG
jgi:FkbM family methyltransferase